MHISSFTVLNTALSGVEAAEQELTTTGENISNESTAGYEEQTVQTSTSPALSVTGDGSTYQVGTGVSVTKVVNSSDSYLDSAWRSQNSQTNSASTLESYTSQLDSAVGSIASSSTSNANPISTALSSFWSAWTQLANNQSNSSAKQAVVSDGTTLAGDLNSLATEISGSSSSSVVSQAAAQYSDLMAGPSSTNSAGGEVYTYANEIASLNTEIVQATSSGTNSNANTLLDERNEYIDELSALGNVTTDSNSDGSVTVYFGGVSTALVSDTSPSATATSTAAGNDFSAWSSAFGTQLSQATSASSAASTVGGTLGALLGLAGVDTAGGTIATASTLNNSTTLSGTIGTVMSSLNSVASDLADEVNSIYSDSGYGDNYFFTTSDGSSTTTAANIAVSSTLTGNASTLGAGASGGADGDNSVALAEAQNSGGTADASYYSFVETVGTIAENAEDNSTTQSALSTQLTNQRDSVEGVDLDAEMTKLISEQQAYEASAKVMNTFNTIMDSLMSVVSG